ncbi:MAG: sugar ABC transporter permease [bacterium]|nr:sugar ABC transporter permease [bacterium]
MAATVISTPSRRFFSKDDLLGYAFVAPQMLGFFLFVLGPLIAVLVYSLQTRNLLTGQAAFTGLENYRNMFSADPLFAKTMWNSLVFAAGLVPLNVGLSLMLALMLSKKLRGITVFRTLYFAPVVTSAVAWAIVWRFLLQGEQGVINQCLALIGIHGPNWLQEPGWAMFAIVITRVFKNVGLNIVIYLAAITNLPEQYAEAASVDGANKVQAFWKISFPLLMPTTMMVTIITIIGSLKVFDHIMLMTGGGPGNATMVAVYYIYYQAFRFFEIGYASGLSVILFGLVLILTIVQWSLRKRVSYYEQD